MKNKTEHCDIKYFSIGLNINHAKELSCSPEEISESKKLYESFRVKDILEKKENFLPELVLLKGKKGEVAYVRNDSDYYERNKYTVVFELPLSLKAQAQRNFVSFTYLLFKDKFFSDTEQIEQKEEFTKIIKKPFVESEHYYYDPDNLKDRSPTFKFRTKTFADSKPHGTYSKRGEILTKRNDWMRKKYTQYRKKGFSEYEAYDKVKEELKNLPKNYLGKWNFKKQNPLDLKDGTVQRIIQSKK